MPAMYFFIGSEFSEMISKGILSQNMIQEALNQCPVDKKTIFLFPATQTGFEKALLEGFQPETDVIIAASAGGHAANAFITQLNELKKTPKHIVAIEASGLDNTNCLHFHRKGNNHPNKEHHTLYEWEQKPVPDTNRDFIGHAAYAIHPSLLPFLTYDPVCAIEITGGYYIRQIGLKNHMYQSVMMDKESFNNNKNQASCVIDIGLLSNLADYALNPKNTFTYGDYKAKLTSAPNKLNEAKETSENENKKPIDKPVDKNEIIDILKKYQVYLNSRKLPEGAIQAKVEKFNKKTKDLSDLINALRDSKADNPENILKNFFHKKSFSLKKILKHFFQNLFSTKKEGSDKIFIKGSQIFFSQKENTRREVEKALKNTDFKSK